MVRISHIGDLQLGIYTNNLKNNGNKPYYPFIMVYGASALIPPVYDWQYRIDWET